MHTYNETFYELYKSMRNLVEVFRDKELSEESRLFIDTNEAICKNFDKKNPFYYKRWEKEMALNNKEK